MKVSIIIPVLNEALNLHRISSQLKSIDRQGHEIIIVDGGSIDDTLTLSYEITSKVLTSEPGRALQMNSGAMIASGEILLFLHADTSLPDNAIQSVIDRFNQQRFNQQKSNQQQLNQPGYWGRFNVRLSSTRPVFRLIESMMNIRSCLMSIATGDQAIFIEKKLFDRIGGFPEITLMEDIEISRRLKKISRPVCIKQRVITSSRRWEKRGVVTTILLMWKLRLYYFFGVSPEKLNRLYR